MTENTVFLIDGFFRFSAISLFLLLSALMLRDFSSRKVAWLGAWSALSGAAYLTCTNPQLNKLLGNAMYGVELFCHTGQIAIWLFSLSQFRDRLKLWPNYVAMGVVFYLLSRVNFVYFAGSDTLLATITYLVFSAARFALIAHMLYVAWQGRDDDLVEARRRFRVVYIIAVSIATFVIAAAETWFQNQVFGQNVMVFQAIAMWALAMLLVWHIIGLRNVKIFGGERTASIGRSAPPKDPNERHDLATVERLVGEEKLFLRPGLTIAVLAQEAGLPEHRLRRLINAHLGYRNFADFLNHYRITAAKERLSQVEERNLPVLTVAMDLGYGSLGPFNRAFKERTGLTPTDYRKKMLAET